MSNPYRLTDPPSSFVVKIPVGKTNYLQIIDSLTAIYGNPVKSGWYIKNSRYEIDENYWVVLLRGQPDKKFTRLCLEYPCKLVEREDDLYSK